jgi:hypothetical protein
MARLHVASAALGTAIGAVMAAVAIPWTQRSDAPVPVSEPLPAAAPAATALGTVPPAPAAAGDAASPTALLQQVLARLTALEQRLDASRVPAPAVSSTPATPVTIDVDALQRAMAEIERRQLEAATSEQLRVLAKHATAGGRFDEAIRAHELLVERASNPQQRAAAMSELAIAQRQRGDTQGLTASAQTLGAIVAEHGAGSPQGLDAQYQLAWTRSMQKDPAAGLQLVDAIVQSPAASADQRRHARWAAGLMLQQLGDTARARTELSALLRELEPLPGQQKLAADITERLRQLDRR